MQSLARALAIGAALLSTPAAVTAQPEPSVLVLPFDSNSLDPRAFWLGEAAALWTIDAINDEAPIAFSRDERVRALDYFNILPTTPVTRATMIRLANALGATDLVVGTITLEGDLVDVRARRLDMATGRLGAEVGERIALSLLDAACRRLPHALGLVSATSDSRPRAPRPPVEAFEDYVKGLLTQNSARQIAFLESAVAKAPTFDEARLALWAAESERGSHDRALAAVRGVSPTAPAYRRAQFDGALSLLDLKRLDEAFSTLKHLVESGGTGPLYNNLGVVQLRRPASPYEGRATYYFNKAAELEPDDPDFCFNLGYAYWLEKDAVAAAYWLREAVRRDPADGDAHYLLGAALQSLGASTEGGREHDLARQLSSKYAEWDARGGAVPRGLERLSSDIEIPRVQSLSTMLGETTRRDQGELAGFYLERGRSLMAERHDTEALSELRKAVYLTPYEAEAHLLIGRIHLRQGQTRQAIDALRVAVWSRDSLEGRLALASALIDSKAWDEARQQLTRALQIDPASSEAKDLLNRIPSVR